jgi:hypothetical protein
MTAWRRLDEQVRAAIHFCHPPLSTPTALLPLPRTLFPPLSLTHTHTHTHTLSLSLSPQPPISFPIALQSRPSFPLHPSIHPSIHRTINQSSTVMYSPPRTCHPQTHGFHGFHAAVQFETEAGFRASSSLATSSRYRPMSAPYAYTASSDSRHQHHQYQYQYQQQQQHRPLSSAHRWGNTAVSPSSSSRNSVPHSTSPRSLPPPLSHTASSTPELPSQNSNPRAHAPNA